MIPPPSKTSPPKNRQILEVTRQRVSTGKIFFEVPAGMSPEQVETALKKRGDLFDMYDTNCGLNDLKPLPLDSFDVAVVEQEDGFDTDEIVFRLSDGDYYSALANEAGDAPDTSDTETSRAIDLISQAPDPSNGPGVLAKSHADSPAE